MGRAAKNARAVFDYLEQNPIIDIGKTAEALNLAFSTVLLMRLLLACMMFLSIKLISGEMISALSN